jgi:Sulfotransferase family
MKSLVLFLSILGLGLANERLIFYHIPKTAGITTRHLIETAYNFNHICPALFFYEIESKSLKDLEKYDLFFGHFFVHSNLSMIKGKRATILRDPVERIISEQNFFESFYKGTLSEAELAKQHYNPEGDPIDVISNQACLYLSSLDRHDYSLKIEDHYQSALENLRHFDFVGVFEEYESSLRSLYDLMGWEQVEIIPTLQVSKKNRTVSLATRQEILERNYFDFLLYEEAKHLFTTRHKVINFKKKKIDQFFKNLSLNFKDKILCEGFAEPVFFKNVLFRPIAPSGFSFIKAPLESGCDYDVVIYANITIKDPDFKIRCCGKNLDYQTDKTRIFLKIPKELIQSEEYTKLEFIHENFDHSNLIWDRSNQHVGIAFRKIDFTAIDP